MTTWSNPMLGNVDGTGQSYGDSRDGGTRRHVGYDIGTGGVSGRPVAAGGDGTVLETRTTSPDARGQNVMLDHGGGIRTLCQHLAAVSVPTGSTVRAGQQIGVCGSTGGNDAIHLHLEVYTGNLGKQKTDHVDPKPFFAARGVTLGVTKPATPTTPDPEDDMPTAQEIAQAIWSYPSPTRPTVTMGHELADIKTKLTRWETDGGIQTTVVRDGQTVPWAKEVVDTTTKVIRIESKIDAITTAVGVQ